VTGRKEHTVIRRNGNRSEKETRVMAKKDPFAIPMKSLKEDQKTGRTKNPLKKYIKARTINLPDLKKRRENTPVLPSQAIRRNQVNAGSPSRANLRKKTLQSA